jgi:hypothetical protein
MKSIDALVCWQCTKRLTAVSHASESPVDG